MDYVMVTLLLGHDRELDLKVPGFVSVKQLLEMLAEALFLTLGDDARLQAEPLGRILDNEKTLQEEGVAHGALLTLI